MPGWKPSWHIIDTRVVAQRAEINDAWIQAQWAEIRMPGAGRDNDARVGPSWHEARLVMINAAMVEAQSAENECQG